MALLFSSGHHVGCLIARLWEERGTLCVASCLGDQTTSLFVITEFHHGEPAEVCFVLSGDLVHIMSLVMNGLGNIAG